MNDHLVDGNHDRSTSHGYGVVQKEASSSVDGLDFNTPLLSSLSSVAHNCFVDTRK
jgi:hypothetical protein